MLTTNQGAPISDNQNSLRAGTRGPTLLEDFIFREKITHFDHERIPERIVHARGSGAHGFFQPYKSMAKLTRAAFLQDPKKKTPVFVRFSTVAGGAGSGDTPRDVRGFAVKFYTEEGNFDLVGNNIPVFFIQDAIKFPDLIHSVKMEPDRGFPQAASAHDTFWDFASLMPESMHMLMWAMSDRTLPRSFRMMEGFGVHTFRLVDADGKSTFVKFHWRPKIGAASLIWDESVKLYGADPDSQRRDLFDAIAMGDFPGVRVLRPGVRREDRREVSVRRPRRDQADSRGDGAARADRPDGARPQSRQLLRRNRAGRRSIPATSCRASTSPNDPLLQGRLFSYTDTQLIRLGGANFHEIPINRPKCPMRNFQRDGVRRMDVPKGQVAYEPNSLAPDGPREDPERGLRVVSATLDAGDKVRERSETFADHYSQPRLFWRSMSEPEQRHIVNAFTFELSKVSTVAIRRRMLGHLANIDDELCERVEEGLGMEGQAETDQAGAPADRHEAVAGAQPRQEGAEDARGPQGRRAGHRRHRRGVRRRAASGGREGRRAAAGRRAEDRRRRRRRAASASTPIISSPADRRSSSTPSSSRRRPKAPRCSRRKRPRSTGCATRSATSR